MDEWTFEIGQGFSPARISLHRCVGGEGNPCPQTNHSIDQALYIYWTDTEVISYRLRNYMIANSCSLGRLKPQATYFADGPLCSSQLKVNLNSKECLQPPDHLPRLLTDIDSVMYSLPKSVPDRTEKTWFLASALGDT